MIIIFLIIIIILIAIYWHNNYVEKYMMINNGLDMPIYIINLESRPDRKLRMENELTKHQLRGHFIKAVNGKDVDINKQTYDQQDYFRKMRTGEIGCYLSHLKCWDLILQSGKPYGMVLEDDTVFIDNFKEIFINAMNDIKDLEWDYIAIGRNCNKKIFDEDCQSGKRINDIMFYPNFIGYATFAYVIKTEAIEKLLKTTYPISKPIDVKIIDEQQKKNIKIITFINNLAKQNNSVDSDTTKIK